MMYPVIRRLLHKRVVLASASPRRQEILSNAVRAGAGAGLGPGRVCGQGGPGQAVCLQDGLGSWAGVCSHDGPGAW